MMTFIAVTLGVVVGILLVTGMTLAVMLNPKIVGWFITKYMSALEKSMKNFEEKMDE